MNRIYQQDLVAGYACGGVGEPCDQYSRPYYRPANNVTRQQMAKFIDNALHLPQINLFGNTTPALIYARNDSGRAIEGSSNADFGVYGTSNSQGAAGVFGGSNQGDAVRGVTTAPSGKGVAGYGHGVTGYGVYGVSGNSGTGTGVYGLANSGKAVWGQSTNGWAGYFNGNVNITGNLSKGGGSFKIDDPLDPANKYLYHSFVESPDMMNVYNGNVTLDTLGEATVQLPDWFGALNKDYRYQLTAVGAPGPNLYISKKVENNHFSISGGTASMEVSWQVTGIRQDPYANAHRIPVEQDKPVNEKGKYLHPTEWGQPASLGVDYEQQKMQQALATESKP